MLLYKLLFQLLVLIFLDLRLLYLLQFSGTEEVVDSHYHDTYDVYNENQNYSSDVAKAEIELSSWVGYIVGVEVEHRHHHVDGSNCESLNVNPGLW